MPENLKVLQTQTKNAANLVQSVPDHASQIPLADHPPRQSVETFLFGPAKTVHVESLMIALPQKRRYCVSSSWSLFFEVQKSFRGALTLKSTAFNISHCCNFRGLKSAWTCFASAAARRDESDIVFDRLYRPEERFQATR